MKTLVVLAHPDLRDGSIANKIIVDAVRDVEGVEIRDLYELYPDFKIDVSSEQQALLAADVVIFQYPFYWYSVPGLLKEWLDRVFLYGFAYGSSGNKLAGKEFLLSTTIGGPVEAYRQDGSNNFTIEELLKPLEQTAYLAGMKFNEPLTTHGMIYIPGVYNEKEVVEQRAREHASRLLSFINGKHANRSR